jgi:hypothetical protein
MVLPVSKLALSAQENIGSKSFSKKSVSNAPVSPTFTLYEMSVEFSPSPLEERKANRSQTKTIFFASPAIK